MYREIVEELHDGKARICRAPEQENYFDVFGEPEGYTNADGAEVSSEDEREEIYSLIDRDGLWVYFAQVKCPCCDQWKTVDSIGMVIGDLAPTGYREEFIDVIKRELV